eukprot:3941321-Rhodomonas_salina.1
MLRQYRTLHSARVASYAASLWTSPRSYTLRQYWTLHSIPVADRCATFSRTNSALPSLTTTPIRYVSTGHHIARAQTSSPTQYVCTGHSLATQPNKLRQYRGIHSSIAQHAASVPVIAYATSVPDSA